MLTSEPKILIALLAGLMFVLAAASLMVLGTGADMATDTGLASDNVSLLVTAFALPYAVFAPVFQLFMGSRYTPRTIVIAGGFILSAGLLLTGLSDDQVVLLASRGISAVGAALITPAALALATLIVRPNERGRAIAGVYLGFTLASVIGVPLGTQLAQLLGWRSTFFVFAGAAFVLALIARPLLPVTSPATALSLQAAADLFRDNRVLCVFGAATAQLAAQFMLLAPMAPILIAHFDLTTSLLPWVLFVFGVAGVVGNQLGGTWSDRYSLSRTLMISLLGLAAALVALSLPLGAYAAAAAFAVLAFFGTVFRPPQIVLLTRLVDNDARSLAIGFNATASYLGLTLGSVASAAVITGLGYGALGWFALAFVLVAALLMGWVRQFERS